MIRDFLNNDKILKFSSIDQYIDEAVRFFEGMSDCIRRVSVYMIDVNLQDDDCKHFDSQIFINNDVENCLRLSVTYNEGAGVLLAIPYYAEDDVNNLIKRLENNE